MSKFIFYLFYFFYFLSVNSEINLSNKSSDKNGSSKIVGREIKVSDKNNYYKKNDNLQENNDNGVVFNEGA